MKLLVRVRQVPDVQILVLDGKSGREYQASQLEGIERPVEVRVEVELLLFVEELVLQPRFVLLVVRVVRNPEIKEMLDRGILEQLLNDNLLSILRPKLENVMRLLQDILVTDPAIEIHLRITKRIEFTFSNASKDI